MDTRQLEAFAVLSECLSVTRTAERLFCTQPAVSISIKKLEERLNTKLFERTDKVLRLTPQGQIYREYVLHILKLLQQSQEHMRLFDDPQSGNVSIGASHFCSVWLLPALISTFRKKYPGVNIRLDTGKTAQLIDKLNAHEVDFIIISDYINIPMTKYDLSHLMDDPFVLICPPGHTYLKQKTVRPDDLERETFLIKSADSATRNFLESELYRSNIRLRQIMEINSLEGIKQGVIHGLGVSIVPRRAILQELNAGLLYEIPINGFAPSRGINCVHKKEKLHSPAVRLFLSDIGSEAATETPLAR